MAKPYGMTGFFEIVRPTEAQNKIYEAVEAAHEAGMTVEDFRAECRECWDVALKEKARMDGRAWTAPFAL